MSISEWKALSGRITLFPTAPASSPAPSALELYRQVWGDDPDNFQKQQNPLLPTIAQGRRNGIMVQLLSQPVRTDFNLSAAPATALADRAPTSLPLIDDTRQLHAELMRIIDALAKVTIPTSVSSVAFNVQFITVKPSVAETNQTLAAVLPDQYRIKLTDEQDFVLQINRPHPSRNVENITINCITKWSMERLQVLSIRAVPAGVISASIGMPNVNVKQFIAASVRFDNNTVPPVPPIPLTTGQQSSLLLEGLTEVAAMQRSIGLNIEGF